MSEPLDLSLASATGEDDDTAATLDVRRTVVDEAGHGQRLDKLLVSLAPEFSRSHLQGLIDSGDVLLEGSVAAQASRKVRLGQAVVLTLRPTAEALAFRPENLPLTIVHEDAHLLVVDKPAGLVVHPAAGNWSGTLLNGLLAHHPGAQHLPRAGIVHRLDKDTSGLMVVGKTLPAVTALVQAIAARSVGRRYLAVAQGRLPQATCRVDAPVGRDPASRLRMAVVSDGKPARTDVTRVDARDGLSAVRCRLHTGRTHQIRVHLAHLGHPLLGDVLYGGRPGHGIERQALHAAALSFIHPITGDAMTWRCQPPGDFLRAWSIATERTWEAALDLPERD